MNIDDILERRHEILVVWAEPWPACGPDGNNLDAHVSLSATVHDVINMSRLFSREMGHPTAGNDKDFLLDFVAVHWADFTTLNHEPI